MKLFVVLALLVVTANCLPQFKRGKKDKAKDEPKEPKDEGSVDMDGSEDGDGDIDDVFRKPLTVREFNGTMSRLVSTVYMADQKVAEFGQQAGETMANPTSAEFDKLGEAWSHMTGFVEHSFDILAFKLAELAFRLYYHSEGFQEVNYCDNYKNFNMEYDPEDVEGYVQTMIMVFMGDLECFRTMFQQVEYIQNELDSAKEGEMAEDMASTLVFEFMKGLHVVRVNAIRFQEAVEEAASKIGEEEEVKAKKEVKKLMQLRDLMRKSGLFRR